jgi:hypothetical protein
MSELEEIVTKLADAAERCATALERLVTLSIPPPPPSPRSPAAADPAPPQHGDPGFGNSDVKHEPEWLTVLDEHMRPKDRRCRKCRWQEPIPEEELRAWSEHNQRRKGKR